MSGAKKVNYNANTFDIFMKWKQNIFIPKILSFVWNKQKSPIVTFKVFLTVTNLVITDNLLSEPAMASDKPSLL